MPNTLLPYIESRADAATFLVPSSAAKAAEELFPSRENLLPQPQRVYFASENSNPVLGYPVADTPVFRELDAKLDRWLVDEVAWQVSRRADAKERAALHFQSYVTHLAKVAENAMLSNLLNDYHGVFWLAHSTDVARNFGSIPRRVSAADTQIGRTQGDALKYRIFAKWAAEVREQMTQIAQRAAAILDGEEQRCLRYFKLLQDDILIFTEEFIGPDLRELRSLLNGYLRRDFQAFRETVESLRTAATDLLQRDVSFRAALPMFGVAADSTITTALLFDERFQSFLFEQPSVQARVQRDDRDALVAIARRVREFAVLNQLRRGIVWMAVLPNGHIIAADKRSSMATAFSRSTRPLDFGRPGVVDPVVNRFGLIYDISRFAETLGNVRRQGRKEEVSSYRQMLLFQRRVESLAQRNQLQFEKFLGDGAFYTTRRALRLVRFAVELQRLYADMKRKGFAFNKGLRIAMNFGYYRLLPLRASAETGERITEFYGPGIVELSRMTTGKANREIDEIGSFLVAHGYDPLKVQQFFAPLARGVDMIDHAQHSREFYAYVNRNGHVVNEGIVASSALLQELSTELREAAQPLFRVTTPWGSYIGFDPKIEGIELIALRLIGVAALKGLDQAEVGEIAAFAPGEVASAPVDIPEPLLTILRQEFHQRDDMPSIAAPEVGVDTTSTHEKRVPAEIIVCARLDAGDNDDIVIGQWDPLSDDVRKPLRIPRGDFLRLCSIRGELSAELLGSRKESVANIYEKLADRADSVAVPLATFRLTGNYEAFVLGDVVEKL
jgi:hypothetical protein